MSASDFIGALGTLIPWWLGAAITLVGLCIVGFWLHEPDRWSGRWWARTAFILVAAFGAVISAVSSYGAILRSGYLQDRIAIVERAATAERLTAADLRKRADIAQTRMAIEDAAVRSALLGLTSARQQVDDVGRATAALASQAEQADATSRQAITASRTAIDQARLASATISTTLAQVRSISRQSTQQLQAAQTVARQAAAKAGVYHIPSSALAEIRSVLLAAPTGKSAIGCSAGLEAACHDLIQAFTDGGWPPSFNSAASFWSGYDALGPDNDPNTGVEVWYSKPSGELIAKRIAAILSIAGLHSATRRRPSDPFDLAISLRFITP